VKRAFLGLGSNLGEREAHLRRAVELLDDVVAVSGVYETDPVGGPSQGPFLNIVVELDTPLSARELLHECRRLEADARRVRETRWGPRTLDVDVLWVDGEEVSEPDLEVPHPRMRERAFVMVPLGELAPDLVDGWIDPGSGRVVRVGDW
jgi:2-amino-4-hydroxy-6-hydroxymethyldihydropteridine diphosphokinase